MPTENLDKVFNPKSIAVVGASDKEGSVGRTLMTNLTNGYKGEVYPVNPNRDSVLGIEAFPSVKKISNHVDLAIIATPAPTVPDIVKECGEAEIPALIIISAGFSETGQEGKKLEEKILEKKQKYGMRILGPNCLGIIRPSINLNATFVNQMPEKGIIALISQSGALASSILDWSISVHIGFSGFVSLGNMLDINFGDLIDYFGKDPETRSILMYVESIKDARNFMSASRGFARTKPIVAVKPGKYAESAEAVASHTGSLAGENMVYDAAFKRVGVTRVGEIEDLFNCSEVLAERALPKGPNIAIITNAGGPGIMATDALLDRGGKLASLTDETIKNLEEILSSHANKFNPIDVLGDTDAERYRKSVEICLKDKNVDGVLVIYTPQGRALSEDVAQAIVDLSKDTRKPILTSLLGGEKVQKGREILRGHNIPTYSTPEQAVKTYISMYHYARNLELLYQTPEELPVDRIPPKYHLKAMIKRIAREGREILTESESKKFLQTYDIPIAETHVAESPKIAADIAFRIGFPVVLKVHSPDITHKSDVGGVVLNLNSKSEIKDAFEEIVSRAKEHDPSAEINGVTVQKMVKDVDYELILGSKKDSLFGPVILFGRGGTGVEIYRDTSIGFPPLNQVLARRLMEETKVYEILRGYRNKPPANLRLLEEHLVRFSQLTIDFPEVKEIDINPLAVVGDRFLALDARIIIDKDLALSKIEPHEHLVIEPYPRKYVEEWRLNDGRPVILRPIKSEDEPLEFELFDTFSEETFTYRFFGPMRKITHKDMVRFTNIDYRREMAIIGELTENGKRKMIGVGRLIIDPGGDTGEFAVVVGDPWHGLGLGTKLVDSIIGVAEDKKLKSIYGIALGYNTRMLNLCRKMGFQIEDEDVDTKKVTLRLR